MKNCTCVIPFYNEENRILPVLSELLKINEFNEIILVDDGSTDNWWSIVKNYIKNFEALRTQGNEIVFSCRLSVMRQQENCQAAESLLPWEHLSFPFVIL